MNTSKKKFFCIAMCMVLVFGLSSCTEFCAEYSKNNEDTETSEYSDYNVPYTFDSVADLKSAIKKNPKQYENKQVSVEGSIYKTDDGTILTDAIGDGGVKFRTEATKRPNITIIISDDKILALLDSGDYVELNGTVRISDTGVFLDGCNYKMIKSIYE